MSENLPLMSIHLISFETMLVGVKHLRTHKIRSSPRLLNTWFWRVRLCIHGLGGSKGPFLGEVQHYQIYIYIHTYIHIDIVAKLR